MKQFEDNIKKNFHERKIQPSKDAWNKLEMLLNEDKKYKSSKKSVRTILFIAASLLIFVSLGTFFLKGNQSKSMQDMLEPNATDAFVVEHEIGETPVTQPEKKESEQKQWVTNESPKKEKLKLTDEHLVKSTKKETVSADLPIDEEVQLETKPEKLLVDSKSVKNISETPTKVDPNKLLMVAEYERNIEKSASQFKQVKEKFQEVKTALNNINQ